MVVHKERFSITIFIMICLSTVEILLGQRRKQWFSFESTLIQRAVPENTKHLHKIYTTPAQRVLMSCKWFVMPGCLPVAQEVHCASVPLYDVRYHNMVTRTCNPAKCDVCVQETVKAKCTDRRSRQARQHARRNWPVIDLKRKHADQATSGASFSKKWPLTRKLSAFVSQVCATDRQTDRQTDILFTERKS